MKKYYERSVPTSCWNRAREDEMVFVLLGRDIAAPEAVQAWIEARIRLGKNTRGDEQILEAQQWVQVVQKSIVRCAKCLKEMAMPGQFLMPAEWVCSEECRDMLGRQDDPKNG